jgi:lipoprotein-anchoring transpeptidase ErfK/SrfK
MFGMSRRRRRTGVIAPAFAVCVLLAGCGGGGDATLGAKVASTTTTRPATTATTVPAWQSYAAKATGSVLQVFDAPDAPQPAMELPNPWVYDPAFPDQTVPQVFLVEQQQGNWVEVLLPVRPNGSTGWVRSTDVTLTPNPFRIDIELGAHRIAVTNRDELVYEGTIAAGKPSTPTPLGKYYLRILIRSLDPESVYGPYAYGLSSHSEVLETFAGGDAEIGIHGNNDASVLGSDVTSGCVRMDNDAITMLAQQLPLGTPVHIRA